MTESPFRRRRRATLTRDRWKVPGTAPLICDKHSYPLDPAGRCDKCEQERRRAR